MAQHAGFDCLEGDEELRFAVVLNGGVSLAVWMGGAVHELDQLTRKKGSYGAVMKLLGVMARADVISGSSAGGINGAALALGQLNSNADLSCLRDLWAEQGRMESLLHRPFVGTPSSLLRGDDFFLPELGKAMERLTRDWDGYDDVRDLADDGAGDQGSPGLARPIDLTITTTLLSGSTQTTPDAFGQLLPQQRHDGRFRFFQGVDENDKDRTHFPRRPQPGPPEVARALALAARCSASFPVAFEPSFVPVNHPDRGADYRAGSVRPDMADYAEWAWGSAADRSRYAVDGGLLANTPTKPALQAVERMKADRPVSRVMLLVYPHAPSPDDDVATRQQDMPSVPTTMGNLLSALTNEGSRTFVDEVEAHNRRAAVRRGTRADVLEGESARGTDGRPRTLEASARDLYPHYLRQRVRRTARDLVQRVGLTAGRSFESVRAAAEAAQCEWMEDDQRDLPYVPRAMSDEVDYSGDGWRWGTTTALDLADTALEIVALLDRLKPELRDQLRVDHWRLQVHQATARMRQTREEIERAWRDAASDVVPDEDYWLLRLDSYALWMLPTPVDPVAWPIRMLTTTDPSGAPARRTPKRADELPRPVTTEPPGTVVAGAVGAVVKALAELIAAYAGLPDDDRTEVRTALDRYATLVSTTQRPELDSQLALALLQLHVVSWTVGEGELTENTQPIDLVQISAAVEHPWAASSRTLEDKLGGASLARFSGFLKASWRMNDWTWGRFDASAMLMRVLLTPSRVKAYATRQGWGPEHARALVDQLCGAAFSPDLDVDVDRRLAVRHERAVTQVGALLSPGVQDPLVLDELANLVVLARHVEIVAEELPAVARAIRADQADGASGRSRGPTFLANHKTLLEELEKPEHSKDVARGLRALDAFDRAGIGREPLDREAASDQMIRTAVTAASVGATLLDSPAAGLGRLNPVTRALRGAMRLPYWVTVGLTAGSTAAAMLAILGLAVGGALLAMTVLGVLSGPIAGAAGSVGAGAAVLAFGYAAMRTGSFLHSVVLLGAAAPLLVLGAREIAALGGAADGGSGSGVTSVAAVVVLTAALVVLGTLPTPLHSPLAMAMDRGRRAGTVSRLAWGRLARRWRAWPLPRLRLLGVGVALAVWVAGWLRGSWSGPTSWPWPDPSLPSLRTLAEQQWWWYVGAAAVGVVPAVAGGIALRTWRWSMIPDGSRPAAGWRRALRWVRREQSAGWRAPRVSLPSGVTVGWSWLYGVLVALGTFAFVRPPALDAVDTRAEVSGFDSPYVWVVLGQGTALVLLVLVPALTPYLTARRLSRRVLKLARTGMFRPGVADLDESPHLPRSELIRWLLDHDLALRYLVRRSWVSSQTLVLRRRGSTLAMKVDQIRAEQSPGRVLPSVLCDEDAPTRWQRVKGRVRAGADRVRYRFRRTQPAVVGN